YPDGTLTDDDDPNLSFKLCAKPLRGEVLEMGSENYAQVVQEDDTPGIQCSVWTLDDGASLGPLTLTWTNPAGSLQPTASTIFYGYTDEIDEGTVYITGDLSAGQTAAKNDIAGLKIITPIVSPPYLL
ncbi:hypothetical protein FRB99_007510, partial [Tulasnella sp. 403]